jgi:hypothetical protein
MNFRQICVSAMAGGFLILGAQSFGQSRDEESREKTIRLSEVPKAAVDAAQKALGMAPTEAKIVSGTTPQQYELEAKNKSGKEISVHVLADGKVVKKEHEEKDKD